VIAPGDPPAFVRAKVMDAIRNVPGSHESRTVRADEGKWSTIAPGARMKQQSGSVISHNVTVSISNSSIFKRFAKPFFLALSSP
jgi:hypothetical protein